MCNLYKTVADIIDETRNVNEYLIDAEKYYAHTPPAWNIKYSKPEILSEHVQLVVSYFKQLVETHRLDNVIDALISEYLSENNIDDNVSGNFIKKLFVQTIVFHDFGKINENFQAASEKMNNPFFKGKEIPNSPIGTTHSLLSAFIFISKFLSEVEELFPKGEKGVGIISVLLFSYSILKHHSRGFNDKPSDEIDFSNSAFSLEKYLMNYQFEINPNITKSLSDTKSIFEHPAFNKYIHSFALYSILRLNYSLLTASDYLATNEYSSQLSIKDLGTITTQRIDEIYTFVSDSEWINQAENKRNYNRDIYRDSFKIQLNNPIAESGENLNLLRRKMGVEVISNIRKNYQNNLFYIEAPTGGGKTNLSLLATIELLKKYKGKLNKVFYVFPFTTLITQTYKSIIETFGLAEDEVVQLHSKVGIKTKRSEDDEYGKDRKNYLDNLFVNFPFCLLTHIKFFNLLKTNRKEENYILHRLANSVVVIDELQSYNPKHWDKVIYFINKYAAAYNIKFILMSATLPKLDKLKVIKNQPNNVVYLLPNAKADYFQNPNFCNRVSFNFDLLENKHITLSEISELLFSESRLYSSKDFGDAKPQESVYTIIEFIFKKTASDFYQIVKGKNTFFDEIFLLSGTILEHRRKEIINFLKNKKNRKKKVLLITTQVVEAGVDIDMDLGFKDTSLVDSDEQLAGRINRNVNKKDCKLFLFSYDKEGLIYGEDKRLEITRSKLRKEDHQHILQTKDFDLLYDLVLDEKNNWNHTQMAIGFSEYEQKIKTLMFETVNNNFLLIEQRNLTCFIPLNIPITVNGTADNSFDPIFSGNELDFLAKYNIFPNLNKEISGREVFDLYVNTIENRIDFSEQKFKEKILQGIMSKFVFSLFATEKVRKQIVRFSDEPKSEYGYKFIEHWQDFYDIHFGMNDKMFNSNETQFL